MNNAKPPHWPIRLLETFCAPHLREEVQGDLQELYGEWVREYGERRAGWLYAFHVIKFLRPYAIKRPNNVHSLNPTTMFRNYVKVGLRNILKYKVFSFINVFGLAVAMSVCMLIILMLVDQKGYDQFHTKKDRIYRIISEPQNAKYATSPVPLANTLASDYTPVAAATHLIQGVGGDAIYDKNIAEMRGFFADTSFFQVFSYELEQGDKRTALASPNTMVITYALAQQLFPEENPLGKTIEFVDRGLPNSGRRSGRAAGFLGTIHHYGRTSR